MYKKTYEKYILHEHRIHYIHLGKDETEKCGKEYDLQSDGIVLFRKFDNTNFVFEENKNDPKKIPTHE
jgi:hypothetical protein